MKRPRRISFREWAYLARYGISCFIFGRRKPIAAGVPLTEYCNLTCCHCVVKNSKIGHYSFEQVLKWIDEMYVAGARLLYLQGGEILTWTDGRYQPNDVIAAARQRGFFRVSAVTNGTLPINLDADAIWVSVDGPPEIHDAIRGAGAFARLKENVSACSHPRLFANLTLNRINAPALDKTMETVEAFPQFKGLSVNFHTPYPGVEKLAIPRAERKPVIDRLLALKSAGHRILNSGAGLRALASGGYPRPSWMIRLVEQGRTFDCCWGREEKNVCDECGYGIIAELGAVTRLRPSAILHAVSLF
jgi:Fe-coproporphyrin III synthase